MSETITVPTEPPLALLESMALRYDHSWGISAGMTDEQIEAMRACHPIMAGQYLTRSQRAAVLTQMRQLHEEVVGKGFYRYE